jgi:uncharacterized protein RhaS with RHS repeats
MKIKAGIFALLLLVVNQARAMRWYSPNTGKFISRDPIEESGGQNLSAFVCNDAVNNCDPLGEDIKTIIIDLGVRQIIPSDEFKNADKSGNTTASFSQISWKYDNADGQGPCVRVTELSGNVTIQYWYAQGRKPHELHHVEDDSHAVNDLNSRLSLLSLHSGGVKDAACLSKIINLNLQYAAKTMEHDVYLWDSIDYPPAFRSNRQQQASQALSELRAMVEELRKALDECKCQCK